MLTPDELLNCMAMDIAEDALPSSPADCSQGLYLYPCRYHRFLISISEDVFNHSLFAAWKSQFWEGRLGELYDWLNDLVFVIARAFGNYTDKLYEVSAWVAGTVIQTDPADADFGCIAEAAVLEFRH